MAVVGTLITGMGLAAGVGTAQADEPVTLDVWQSNSSGTQDVQAQSDVTLGSVSDGAINVRVDDSLEYQPYLGVGASFSDSSASLLMDLKTSNPTRYDELMTRVFSTTEGEGMAMWRVPMGASDFTEAATHWTNADTQGPSGDPLANFGLTDHDTDHIIPVIQDALAINPDLKIIASPWTAPAWMKTNNSLLCNTNSQDSELLPAYYDAWADYFVRWIDAYQAEGVPIWAITPQNEPKYCPETYTGMSWSETQMLDWVNNDLYPALQQANLDPKILGFDHNFTYSSFAEAMVAGTTSTVMDGLAWHCYDNNADPAFMTKLRNMDPSRIVVETECSSNTLPTDIIRFSTAEMALESFQNYAQGAILWNLALDSTGGPHNGGCVGCVPVATVETNEGVTDWELHPNLSSLAQISRFVKPGAVRIDSTVDAHGIVTAAFANPDESEVLVATNVTENPVTFNVRWNRHGSFSYTLPSRSVVTFVGDVPAAAPLNASPTAGKTYRIVSRASGKPIGVCAGATNDGACLFQWSDDGDADQRWTLADAGNGYLNLVNVGSGKAMDVPGGTTTDGTQLQQWSISGSGNWNQQWSIQHVGDGWYTIVNRTSGDAVDVASGSVTDGASIQQWTPVSGNTNQQFRFIPYN
ncbi:putative glycosyl hydrolase [Microbacterium esteraromaticum]|uniref:Putative glycosyl hydrolase n=1 Tax=Microbacterium esteraromaticum TaxID=57043 RepID=A0A1R4KIA9_9MICO|nr:RICIN domain-containing protein [Microbacterium esteraromaticum]SJN43813.1 putative glycosyl hydrolase [Microbacterium esteraromaticum]